MERSPLGQRARGSGGSGRRPRACSGLRSQPCTTAQCKRAWQALPTAKVTPLPGSVALAIAHRLREPSIVQVELSCVSVCFLSRAPCSAWRAFAPDLGTARCLAKHSHQTCCKLAPCLPLCSWSRSALQPRLCVARNVSRAPRNNGVSESRKQTPASAFHAGPNRPSPKHDQCKGRARGCRCSGREGDAALVDQNPVCRRLFANVPAVGDAVCPEALFPCNYGSPCTQYSYTYIYANCT